MGRQGLPTRVGPVFSARALLAGFRRGAHDRHAILHPREHLPGHGLERQRRPSQVLGAPHPRPRVAG